jgi:hypothetical protein
MFLEFNLTIMSGMYIHPSYLSLSFIATAPPLANKLDSNKSDHSSMDVYNMDEYECERYHEEVSLSNLPSINWVVQVMTLGTLSEMIVGSVKDIRRAYSARLARRRER